MFILPGEIFICYVSSSLNSNVYFYEIALGVLVTFYPLFVVNDFRKVKLANPDTSLFSFKRKNSYLSQTIFSLKLSSLIIKLSFLLITMFSAQVLFQNYAPLLNHAFLPTNEITYVSFFNVFIYLFIASLVDLIGTSYDDHYYIFNEEIDAKMVKSCFTSEGVVGLSWISLGLVIFIGFFFLTQQNYAHLYSYIFLLIAIVLALLGVEYRIPHNELASRLKLADIPLGGQSLSADTKKIGLSWRFRDQAMNIEITMSDSLKQEENQQLSSDEDGKCFANFVDLGCTDEVKYCATLIRKISINKGLTSIQEALNVVELVKSFSLRVTDEEDKEDLLDMNKVCLPVAALYNANEGVGLNDRTILAATILHYLGSKVGLFVFTIESTNYIGLAYSSFSSSKSLKSKTINRFSRYVNNDLYYYLDTFPKGTVLTSPLVLETAEFINLPPKTTPFQKI